MHGNPTCFLSAQEVRTSKVVKLRLKHGVPLQNENRVFFNPRQIKKRDRNAVADEGGVITERMNKRKRPNTKEEMKKQLRQSIKKVQGIHLCVSVSLPLSFILRCSKTKAALLRHCYQHWWDTHTHIHPAGRQALCYPPLNRSNDKLEIQNDI